MGIWIRLKSKDPLAEFPSCFSAVRVTLRAQELKIQNAGVDPGSASSLSEAADPHRGMILKSGFKTKQGNERNPVRGTRSAR